MSQIIKNIIKGSLEKEKLNILYWRTFEDFLFYLNLSSFYYFILGQIIEHLSADNITQLTSDKELLYPFNDYDLVISDNIFFEHKNVLNFCKQSHLPSCFIIGKPNEFRIEDIYLINKATKFSTKIFTTEEVAKTWPLDKNTSFLLKDLEDWDSLLHTASTKGFNDYGNISFSSQ